MPIFDNFPPASFQGVKFPVSESEIRGGLRDHVHEYPHSAGGTPEKMGRKLYEITLTIPAHATFRRYPTLYPDDVNFLQDLFEAQTTDDLVVPNIGTIRAYCYDWTRKASGKKRSGEDIVWRFREDPPADALDAWVVSVDTSTGLMGAVTNLETAMEAVPPGKLAQLMNQLGSLIERVNDMLAYKDQADLYGNLLEAKLLGIADLCSQIDGLTDVKDPRNWRLADAMRSIWASTVGAVKDLDQKKQVLQTYVTPAAMTITDVSKALYRDAKRGMDILRLNAIEDAYAIPRGTSVRYYPDAS